MDIAADPRLWIAFAALLALGWVVTTTLLLRRKARRGGPPSADPPGVAVDGGQPYRTLFAESEDAIALLALDDLRVLAVNRATCELFRREEADLLGRPGWSFRPAEAQQDGRVLMERAAREGYAEQNEIPLLRGDETRIYADTRVKRITIGEADYLMVSARECTERKRLADALQEANQFLATLIERAEIAVMAVDLEGRVILYNPKAEEISGYSREEVRTDGWSRLLPRDTRLRRQALVRTREMLEGQAVDGQEWDVKARDGSVKHILVSGARFHNAGGEAAGLVWFATDITERKTLESQLAEYAENLEGMVLERTVELAQSERRYRDLYDSAPDLYVTVDAEGLVTDVNHAVLETLGRTRDEVVGSPVTEFMAQETRDALARWLMRLEEGAIFENVEASLVHATGSPIETIMKTSVQRDAEGDIDEIRIVLRDITRRKILQRQLVQTEKLATTGRLAASVAHEINNPLQALLVHVGLVGEALPAAFTERDSWEHIQDGLERVNQVVHDLLDLHRAGRDTTSRVDLNALAREALGLTESQRQADGIDLEIDLEAGLPEIPGDPQHLYQVILNLILNGAEAMRTGGVLRVTTRTGQDRVALEVADTGPGLPPGEMSTLFDPFYSHRKPRGTGLGLFVTYSLVKQHHGDIEVESAVGEGCLVRVLLPREEVTLDTPEAAVESLLPPD